MSQPPAMDTRPKKVSMFFIQHDAHYTLISAIMKAHFTFGKRLKIDFGDDRPDTLSVGLPQTSTSQPNIASPSCQAMLTGISHNSRGQLQDANGSGRVRGSCGG